MNLCRFALAGVLAGAAIASTLALPASAATTVSASRPCPSGWVGSYPFCSPSSNVGATAAQNQAVQGSVTSQDPAQVLVREPCAFDDLLPLGCDPDE
jgi:hypothetical protein